MHKLLGCPTSKIRDAAWCCVVQEVQDDEKVKEAADVAQAAFEGSRTPNGADAPREAPPPAAKKPSDDSGNLTEKEGRATGW